MPRARIAFFLAWAGALLAVIPASAQSKTDRSADEGEKTAAGESGRGAVSNSSEGFGLLRVAKVQNDLRLSEQQRVQILALSMEMRKTRFDMKKKLAEILSPDQLQRLKQIRLQVEGPAGMNSHEVAMALGLTREQRLELKALQDQIRKDIEILFEGVRGLPIDQRRAKLPEIVGKVQQIQVETTRQALEVLTPRQREAFDEMQGEKLDLAPSMP